MKDITKENKGITLIALVITVIVMLILISITTYTGIDTYKYSQVTKFVTQMELLQTKIDDLVASKTKEELNSLVTKTVTEREQALAIINAFSQGEVQTTDMTKYKVFTKEDVLNILDVEDVQNDILVNFETREIVSVEGIEYEGDTYYTQYKLPGGQTVINKTTQIYRDTSFTSELEIEGLNATVTISNVKITNANLKYKEIDSEYWQNITNYTKTDESYSIIISKTGSYIISLTDNTNIENSTEETISITVTNKPKTENKIGEYDYGLTSDKWAYAQKENVNYVWIPRFAYKTNTTTNTNEIKFIKGNSSISTDNIYIDDTWTIHDRFTTESGFELTGIWVSVENANQTELDMITLLNKDDITTKVEI